VVTSFGRDFRALRAAFVPPSRTPPLNVPADPGSAPWAREFMRRVRHRFVLKTLGISGFMWIFFVAYFHLLRHPAQPVIVMPLTAVDRWVGFEPAALAAYVSLWVYVGIPAGLMRSLQHLVVYGLWIGALCLAGLACFYLVPTAVPAMALPVDVALHPGFALLQGVDASGNACPSLHVATAVFSALWIDHLLRGMAAPAWPRVGNAAWVLLIVWSTMATKQHVALDVAAGTLLALLFAAPSMRWFPADAPWTPEGGR
jgi:membrane-associated phospholipid phosphatase